MGELLHRVLHLLLGLREAVQGLALRRNCALGIEIAQATLRLSHRAPGLLDVFCDLGVERREKLEEGIQLLVEILGSLLDQPLPLREIAQSLFLFLLQGRKRFLQEGLEVRLEPLKACLGLVSL